ncbi:hypothetical protein CO019_00350 [Candidatus Berkelbacteria bacterium CG_4_9_14_0_2_um_filter_42_30]|uniref:5'-deoxynucleotidase n=6 Tax=Candidatus Berkelbacteria TaxID=1618330 RepID=A0A2M7K1Y3_9BACT|nr:MAG: hypothetical protein AUJ40_01955 [Candidatus Berkelbacteria bacterium CG1_02_42_45]PIP50767.1 MAG: hypothetical protein COX11_02340 [Candidatus Berkelbacteria bacterium CG23_combo_of_CG06-09_8_20_14_all_41_73]PIR27584.1 MAG: hypothetical protein COV40_00045 [Candidatus Berkelbacteria bacterium CG11_big_fil_rev_8_21_14_0_20_42_15]PIX30250.1 MAG: hypothetical protein COZ63_00720 [Candidatus Berkelbacteria bacterium CG_4_8_14_3_um_filter_42_13]PIZ27629.1 MAG: hypothetical protein COY45_014
MANKKRTSTTNKRVLYLIQQAGTLMLMQRNHIRNLGNISFDTIASHSFHVANIAYCIARMEGMSHEDGLRAMSMGVIHDLAEARTGDNDFISKNYTTMNEKKAVEDQFSGIKFGNDLKNEILEYEKRETKVSKCVKDADCLAQMYMEWTLSWQGNKLAEKWFRSDMKYRVPYLKTKSAKKLIALIKKTDPQDWWWNQFVDNRGPNLKHLNG